MAEVVQQVITKEQLEKRIGELGAHLSDDYRNRDPILVAVMQGAMWFLADLVREMSIDIEIDFLALNRFDEGGHIRIAADTASPLTNRNVVIVEDLIDTGLSLSVLRSMLEERQPASLATVTLIDKVARRLTEVPIEYRGFEAGDEYLIGYGFDHEGRFRNLPSVWAVMDPPRFLEDPDAFAQRVFQRP